jgi:hypothetical protein
MTETDTPQSGINDRWRRLFRTTWLHTGIVRGQTHGVVPCMSVFSAVVSNEEPALRVFVPNVTGVKGLCAELCGQQNTCEWGTVYPWTMHITLSRSTRVSVMPAARRQYGCQFQLVSATMCRGIPPVLRTNTACATTREWTYRAPFLVSELHGGAQTHSPGTLWLEAWLSCASPDAVKITEISTPDENQTPVPPPFSS